MLVESVNPHTRSDCGAAIMGSYTPPKFGTRSERSQMFFTDEDVIGWGDDSLTISFEHGGTHGTYELLVDAEKNAHLSVDGVEELTRSNFVTNGTIAIGDQTNEAGLDSTLRIRSVTRLCL
jgi:hypothetical protein